MRSYSGQRLELALQLESEHRARFRAERYPALQLLNTVHAETGAFSTRVLRQAHRQSVLSQEISQRRLTSTARADCSTADAGRQVAQRATARPALLALVAACLDACLPLWDKQAGKQAAWGCSTYTARRDIGDQHERRGGY
jgi:hypothetical protein